MPLKRLQNIDAVKRKLWINNVTVIRKVYDGYLSARITTEDVPPPQGRSCNINLLQHTAVCWHINDPHIETQCGTDSQVKRSQHVKVNNQQ